MPYKTPPVDLLATRQAQVPSPQKKVSDGKQAEKAATDFEALLLQGMLQSMWSTVPKGEMLSGSREEELYRDFMNQALAESMAENQSIGIKDMVLKDIRKLEK